MFKLDLLKKKKELPAILLIILISSIFSLPLLSPGFIQGHDSFVLLANAAALIESLRDGQFPPRWAGDLNFGYGSPIFIIYYPLGGYLISIMHFLGLGLERSYEIILTFSFIFAPVFFYLFAKQLFEKNIAFVSSIFYAMSPYLFLDIYVRTHIGESLALALIPLVLFYLEKNFKRFSLTNVILGGVVYALLILSHGIIGLIFSAVFILYIFLKSPLNIKNLSLNFSPLILGLILSAYFWFPSFIESRHINSLLFLGNFYKGHFISLQNTIYSSWGFGSNINEPGGISPQIGPIHFSVALLSLLLVIKKINRKIILFWFTLFLLSIFFSTSLSNVFWEKFHTLQRIQFPWRFMSLAAFGSAILSGYVVSYFRTKKLQIFIIILLLALSIPMARIGRSESFSENLYFNYYGSGAFHNEATTVWVAGDFYKFPKKRIEIIGGNGEIKNLNKKSNIHTFEANGKSSLQILDNTTYFPGWRVEVDGAKVPIQFQDPNHRGLITFDVPKGRHIVKVAFGESPIRLLSDIISLLGFFLLIAIILFKEWLGKFLKIKVY